MRISIIIKVLCIILFVFLITNITAIAQIHSDSSGNVGIGITNPNYDLDVGGNINFTGSLYQNGTPFVSGGGGVWEENGGDVYRSTGNVGIGTTNPEQKLHILGRMLVDNTGDHSILYINWTLAIFNPEKAYILLLLTLFGMHLSPEVP